MTRGFEGSPPFPEGARIALANPQLRRNMANATHTIRTKRDRVVAELDTWEDLRLAAEAIKNDALGHLDELIVKVWKQPAFFLTHPTGIAAFGRECTRRGVPPATVSMFGSQFITWRGIPLIPSDKVPLVDGKTKILLMRVGEERQGVVGLYQPGLSGEQGPGLSVRFMGISRNAIASYLISLYCSLAVLTVDALAVIDDVEVGKFHDYQHTYR